MTTDTIIKILDLHNIPYKVIAGRVIADSLLGGESPASETVDVTTWTRSQLAAWLGY